MHAALNFIKLQLLKYCQLLHRMEKKCFIIMPLSDPDGYAKGHINRVYQYIIMPACRQAGFSPVRASDPSIADSPLDIINMMIESDMVLCDLSANDPHALYGFAIRQGMGLPVTIMKDLKTYLTANIPEYDRVEYDESLRIDTVQNEIETLGDALKKTYSDKAEANALLSRLNIGSAPFAEAQSFPVYSEIAATPEPTTEDEDKEEKVTPLPVISPVPHYVGEPLTQDEIDHLKVGDFFFHMNYGKGEILTINTKTKDRLMKVQFDSGSKLLVLLTSGIFRKIIE
jgi:hypothetical protein